MGADPTTAAQDMQEVLNFETQLANVCPFKFYSTLNYKYSSII